MFVCLDLETTGLSPRDDKVIEVAIVHFDHSRILNEWSTLVNPGVPIPEFTRKLTGITDEMVADAPTLEEIADTIRHKVGRDPIVGHYIFFDVNFLQTKGIAFDNPQLDTCQLTQMLLHKEPSYSLEVLTKKLGITQDDAHRALDDVKANVELFWQLAEHVRALTPQEKAALKPLLKKGQWDWAPIVLQLLAEDGETRLNETASTRQTQSDQHCSLAEITAELTPPFLVEEASHTYSDLADYAAQLDGPSLLSVPDLSLMPARDNIGVLKHPNQYVNEERFKVFTAQPQLDAAETLLAAKVALWLQKTQRGERSELRLVKEENTLWFDICCQESTDAQSFYKRALDAAQQKGITVIDHLHFLKERARKEPTLPLPKHVIVGNTEQLVRRMEWAWHIQLSESRFLAEVRRLKRENPQAETVLDHLAGKISILFGFMGMVIQQHGEPEDPRHLLIVEAHHRNTLEWNKVEKSAQAIGASLAALGDDLGPSPTRDEFERYLGYLNRILQTDGPMLWMTATPDGQIILHAFPEHTDRIFSQRVWKDIEQLHLFCHHADLNDDFAFLKRELGLPDELPTRANPSILALPLLTPEAPLPSPKDPRNIPTAIKEIGTHLQELDGDCFLFATSKKAAEQFFYKMDQLAQDSQRHLRVQNMGGGMGKIVQLSRQTPGKNIFVGNERFLNFVLDEGVPLAFLAIHRLPFSHPNDPIQKGRASRFDNAFQSLTLPQTQLRLQGIFNKFLGNHWQGKRILMLDPRWQD